MSSKNEEEGKSIRSVRSFISGVSQYSVQNGYSFRGSNHRQDLNSGRSSISNPLLFNKK